MSISELKTAFESSTGLQVSEAELQRRLDLLLIAAISNISSGTSSVGTTGANSSVSSSTSSVVILSANPNRKFAYLRNDSTSVCWVSLTGTASSSSALELSPDQQALIDNYTGAISAIWDTQNGSMQILEVT